MKDILNCKDSNNGNEFGGVIRADYIKYTPMQSFIIGFAVIYPFADYNARQDIDKFVRKNLQYQEKSINEIGIETFERLYNEFKKIIEKVRGYKHLN